MLSLPLVLVSFYIVTACGTEINSTEQYPYSESLVEGHYILYWKYNDTHITFETHVKTLGWVGFGISGTGKMYPADVIIGWVKNGSVSLQDRSAMEHGVPEIDDNQDWHLVFGAETDDTTVLKFERALDTCDAEQDRPITSDLMHVIFSWHQMDPDPTVLKHERRGTRMMYLIEPISQSAAYPPDVESFLFISHQERIPPGRTKYVCTSYIFPTTDRRYHAIAMEPVIEVGNEAFVHHMILWSCSKPFRYLTNGTSSDCYHNPERDHIPCNDNYYTWAVGGKAMYLPDKIGIPFGSSQDTAYFVLEVHYAAEGQLQERTDSSGIRVIYTPTLRTFDAGLLRIGIPLIVSFVIPPHYKSFVARGICSSECLNRGLHGSENDVNIFAASLHSHLIGRKMRLRHIRNGEELKPIFWDDTYDFNFQQTRFLKTEEIVKFNDTLIVECVYDSSDRKSVTMGGFNTTDEMCIAFTYYYPKMKSLYSCGSFPKYNIPLNIDKQRSFIEQKMNGTNWSKASNRQNFQCLVDGSEHAQVCMGYDIKKIWLIPPVKIDRPYVAKTKCSSEIGNKSDDYEDQCQVGSAPIKRATECLFVTFLLLLTRQ